MLLSWNEIKSRAIIFSRDWVEGSRERAEAQTFWNEFFHIFGIRRRTVASFEEPVRNLGGATDFIDLLWKGRLIAEHKSCGLDLGKARTQALGYVQSLHNDNRSDEAPRYILVSDFARFALHDLEPEPDQPETIEFDLADLPANIRHFAFIAGYETRRLDAEDPANLQATKLLANLHDRLEDNGYAGHDLQRFMVRILFCLFAEDTAIFEPAVFTNFIKYRTREDGVDVGAQLSRLFELLNTPIDQRQRNLDEDLASLPYVNGQLFTERLHFADFNAPMRIALLACCNFFWEKISPAVFGSLFQGIMQPRERRQIGAHYTSERDIMKLIRSLFLDDLRERFKSIGRDGKALERFHRELSELRILDPACGCGDFLVIGYRELRRLEMEILQALYGDRTEEVLLWPAGQLNVAQFHGIEIEEWPVRVAEVAMWLMDHQMNSELFARFGQVKATIPLKQSPHIVQANALRIDWNDVLPAKECKYVMGNPPFVGARYQNPAQHADMDNVTGRLQNAGLLDYVAGWYLKAVAYSQKNTLIRFAFVSTNSITQGEQVSILWPELFRQGVILHFGHRTFVWESEARGAAHVHVVIVGFGLADRVIKKTFDYDPNPLTPTVSEAVNINPYLVDGPNVAISNRIQPLCNAPEMRFGNQPIDGGHLILEEQDRAELLRAHPNAKQYIRLYLGSREFINGERRYCLWFEEADPTVLRSMRSVMERIEAVGHFRLSSKREATRQLARSPSQFAFISHPSVRYLLIPSVSSERRPYIPIGFMSPKTIASNLCLIVPGATKYHFGILTSTMHMAWVAQVCGRLKSDYRYSAKLVYNNYPWPQTITPTKRQRVESAAQAVLDARAKFPDSTLADLYDPNAMPPALRRAHDALDRAVDRCYRSQPFISERQRLEYLFNLYEQLIAPLTPRTPPRRRRLRA